MKIPACLNKTALKVSSLLMCCFAPITFANSEFEISDAWSPATPPVITTQAGYFTLTNNSQLTHALVKASSVDYDMVGMHKSIIEGGVASMEMLDHLEISPGQTIRFSPGGLHLMLMQAHRPHSVGETFSVTLYFDNADPVTFEMRVLDRQSQERHENDSQAWEACALCHGADGVSAMPKFPKLAGQKQAYLFQQFTNFRKQQRRNDGGQMAAISTEISESSIKGITQYFASLQPPAPSPRPTDNTQQMRLFDKGKALYQRACSTCHSDTNSSAPWLDAQHPEYLTKQLKDFREDRRSSGDSGMKAFVSSLSDEDIDALAIYLASTSIRNR